MLSGQDKLKAIATLHMIAYASDAPADQVGAELLFAIGYVLEGVPLEQLDLTAIDKDELIREVGRNGGYTTHTVAYAGGSRRRPDKKLSKAVKQAPEVGGVSEQLGLDDENDADGQDCDGLEAGMV